MSEHLGRRVREPKGEPTMRVEGFRIYTEGWLESMDSDAEGRPTINGVRVSDEQWKRGWVLVKADGSLQ